MFGSGVDLSREHNTLPRIETPRPCHFPDTGSGSREHNTLPRIETDTNVEREDGFAGRGSTTRSRVLRIVTQKPDRGRSEVAEAQHAHAY